MNIVKEVDPPTTRTTANTTLTKKSFFNRHQQPSSRFKFITGTDMAFRKNSLSKEKATGMNGYM
jgi:hypothetical protein